MGHGGNAGGEFQVLDSVDNVTRRAQVVIPADPSLRLIPRTGASSPTDLAKVDPELQDLVKVD
jgi:hypothetical protein